MKFFNLNLYKGKCLPAVLAYIKKERFDIIHLQEVSGPGVSFNQWDCFAEIIRETALQGEILTSWTKKQDPAGYFSNATFYSSRVKLKEQINLSFAPFQEIEDPENLNAAVHPKNALFLRFGIGEKEFWTINTHMAWGPTPFDEPYKVDNARVLAAQLSLLEHPFILSGDFNVVTTTEVMRLVAAHGTNLTEQHGISNTLNARLHKAQHLFPPGLAVDFIIVHEKIKTDNFKVVQEEDLSDHLGLTVEFSILA